MISMKPFGYIINFFYNSELQMGYAENISHVLRWSALAKVGRTWVMRLTVFAPLIGYIVIFNSELISIFSLSNTFLERIGIRSDHIISINFFNIYFMYFGLISLGVGSFLFGIFCPDVVKSSQDSERYANSTEMDRSPVLAKSSLQFVLDAYFDHNRDVEADNIWKDPEYPNALESDFYNLIDEMFRDTEEFTDDSNDINTEQIETLADQGEIENQPDLYKEFYLPTGYPNIHEIAHAVWSNPKAIWAFTQPFRALAPKYAKDISFVMYKTHDYSRYNVRRYIFILYGIGFILLLIPSTITFFRILYSLFIM